MSNYICKAFFSLYSIEIEYIMVFCFREISNGIEKKGKKKSVGRPPGPYTRKMIQKTAEPPLVRGYVGICSQRGRMHEITKKLVFFFLLTVEAFLK